MVWKIITRMERRVADWSKLVRKHQRDVLEEGETVEATLLVNPRGSIRNAAIAGGIGGALGSAGAAAGMRAGGARALAQMSDTHDMVTLAGRFPVGFTLVSLTNRRVLVFERDSIQSKRPRHLVAVYPREALIAASTERRFLKRDLTLVFVDDSVLHLEAGVAQPFDRFEDLVNARN